jgi:hypothetical protein
MRHHEVEGLRPVAAGAAAEAAAGEAGEIRQGEVDVGQAQRFCPCRGFRDVGGIQIQPVEAGTGMGRRIEEQVEAVAAAEIQIGEALVEQVGIQPVARPNSVASSSLDTDSSRCRNAP